MSLPLLSSITSFFSNSPQPPSPPPSQPPSPPPVISSFALLLATHLSSLKDKSLYSPTQAHLNALLTWDRFHTDYNAVHYNLTLKLLAPLLHVPLTQHNFPVDDIDKATTLADSLVLTLEDFMVSDLSFFDNSRLGNIVDVLSKADRPNAPPPATPFPAWLAALDYQSEHIIDTHRPTCVSKIASALATARVQVHPNTPLGPPVLTLFTNLEQNGEWLDDWGTTHKSLATIMSSSVLLKYRPLQLLRWLNHETAKGGYWYVHSCWQRRDVEGLVDAAVFVATVGDEREDELPMARRRPKFLIERINNKCVWMLERLEGSPSSFHDMTKLCWAMAMSCERIPPSDSNVAVIWSRLLAILKDDEPASSSSGLQKLLMDQSNPQVEQTLLRLSQVLLVDAVENFGLESPPAWLLLRAKHTSVESESAYRTTRDEGEGFVRVRREVEEVMKKAGVVCERDVDPRANIAIEDASKWEIQATARAPAEATEDAVSGGVEGAPKKKRKRNRRGIRYQRRHPEEFYDSPGFLMLDLACPKFRLGMEVVPETRHCVDPGTGIASKDGLATMKDRMLRKMKYDVTFITVDEWDKLENKEDFVRRAFAEGRWTSAELDRKRFNE